MLQISELVLAIDLPSECKHRDGEAALPVFDLSVPDDTVYDSWTMGARERERLRRLSESLLRVMGTRAAPYTLRVA
jgi:hypothetical protein